MDSGFVEPADSAALDEAILEAHVRGLVPCTLHFYIRSRPTVSVGYFQKVSESLDLGECERWGVAVVRRKSGGRSIYTDRGQLIYGLVVGQDRVPRDPAECFRVVCSALARAISSFGVDARYRPMNDVEIQGRKISGNAQLRRGSSVLQHGTVLVDTDLGMMDRVLRPDRMIVSALTRPSDRVVTLSALLGKAPDMVDLKARVAAEIASTFSVEFEEAPLTGFERALVRSLVEQRYGLRAWNFKL